MRVICSSVRDCYGAVGSIHANWRPVQGRFKDFIAMPKFNLYQSLHTTVVGPQGKMVEFQVRTVEMDARAQRGMAAHWAYKDSLPSGDMAWLSRIIGLSDDASDPSEFMANLRTDLEQEELAVFSPKGAIVTLPVGATPVDFAYAIHTEIGNACVGASVDGGMVEPRPSAGNRRRRRDLHLETRHRSAQRGVVAIRNHSSCPDKHPSLAQSRAT